MGIKSLFGFGQARDKPVRNYSNGEYTFNFGRSTSGKSVNEIRNIDKGLSDGLECIGGEPRGFHGTVDGAVAEREPLGRLSGREVHRIY